MRLFLFLTIVTISIPAFANDPCASGCGVPASRDFGNLIHKVADYIEGSLRTLVETMSQADQDRYAPTGTIRCGKKFMGSAQLTLKEDILTTAAHIFTNENDCTIIQDPTKCSFHIKVKGLEQVVPISAELGSGYVCPQPPDQLPLKSYRDWLILKLKDDVKGVKAYQVSPTQVRNLNVGDNVTTIGHSTDFHAKASGGEWVNVPKHHGTCPIMNVDPPPAYYFAAPCGCGSGCSGGSLLSNGKNPMLLGIFSGGLESDADRKKAILSAVPNRYSWNLDRASSFYVPLAGDFLKKLIEVAH